MKYLVAILTVLFVIHGCAPYKQLKPKPPIMPMENDFIELKRGDEWFELKKEKKYYIEFPAAISSNFYLVLDISNKDLINAYLTETFDQGKGRIIEITDESPEPDHLQVFPIDNRAVRYYWVIDLVRQDVVLTMRYRYVARWRFKYERERDALRASLDANKVDRRPYETLGVSLKADDIDLKDEITQVEQKQQKLSELTGKMEEIAEIFPANILNSQDPSYLDYLSLKKDLEDEIDFQNLYLQLLKTLDAERSSRGDTKKFVDNVSVFDEFFKNRDLHASNVLQTVRDLISQRLPEVVPYYEDVISRKANANRIESNLSQLAELVPQAGLVLSKDLKRLLSFVRVYNQLVDQVWNSKKSLEKIINEVAKRRTMPDNAFFSEKVTQLSKLKYQLPTTRQEAIFPYQSYRCVRILSSEIQRLTAQINDLLDRYRRADALVPRINLLRQSKDIRGILSILKQHPDLDFLYPMYQQLDEESLQEQAQNIRYSLRTQDWAGAEAGLKNLYYDENFINYQSIQPRKLKLVNSLQDSLFQAITTQSRSRAQQFVDENLTTLANVEGLYQNPVFLPVYQPTFFAGNQSLYSQKMKTLLEELETLKTITFPQRAIERLYDELIANPEDQGVHKARAIVIHGRHYAGKETGILNRIAECDPETPKTLKKAREYRRIFTIPVTSNTGGPNEYLLRIRLDIPSQAQFPIYDVYLRLPRSLAQQASSRQFYSSITFNGEQIKNEGRYSIVAPDASNNYESQIGPLQIDKGRDNILEIRFRHNSFRLYQISVMAQKPIIKKH